MQNSYISKPKGFEISFAANYAKNAGGEAMVEGTVSSSFVDKTFSKRRMKMFCYECADKVEVTTDKNIVNELNGLIEHLTVYRDALTAENDDALSTALKEGRLIRETIKRGND